MPQSLLSAYGIPSTKATAARRAPWLTSSAPSDSGLGPLFPAFFSPKPQALLVANGLSLSYPDGGAAARAFTP